MPGEAAHEGVLRAPYFAIGVSYARAALSPAIAPAPLPEHFDALVDFTLLARWGTHAPSRASPTAAPANGGAAVVGV